MTSSFLDRHDRFIPCVLGQCWSIAEIPDRLDCVGMASGMISTFPASIIALTRQEATSQRGEESPGTYRIRTAAWFGNTDCRACDV